ncbi:PREDICTED: LOW QUALITY PROTEIN: olfactory receptor 6B2-like [Pygoscelis adeliae]|uniref:LOW QUALITY PROTEIN: olfactory receptor 6B2-like n=1 Tax=Pygoscelis adeliae TaxID=9238 RepID=UPI0004F4F2B4|nr:PREDICTED: LOW QUALITY PROTEIN: olfactory receptor 6B2-like [Pygoscelis adeliae]
MSSVESPENCNSGPGLLPGKWEKKDKQSCIKTRKEDNWTSPMEFLLLGMGKMPTLQIPLFLLSLIIYLVIVIGNILIVVLVASEQHLHTPMYTFLGTLSFLETWYSSIILPRLLASFLTGGRTISAHDCMAQFYFFSCFVATECYLLGAMSYDQYLAICQPLLYASLMTGKICLQLVAASWLVGMLVSATVTAFLSQINFCGHKIIDHFFCDFTPLLQLSCSDTSVVTLVSFLRILFPFLFMLVSYVCITAAILRISSNMGRQKTFSTCSSHLNVVTIFYITLLIAYLLPRTAPLRQLNKVFSFFYIVLMPLVNPFIYILRNKEVREALRKALRKAMAST